MPLLESQVFIPLYKGKGRLLGLDMGTKRIGVAISDRTWLIASPLKTIEHKKFTITAQEIQGLYTSHQTCGIVMGLPLNMDGTPGPKSQSIHDFTKNLLRLYPEMNIVFLDERLSTVAVESVLLQADISRQRRQQVIDKMAASYILQNFLLRAANAASSAL